MSDITLVHAINGFLEALERESPHLPPSLVLQAFYQSCLTGESNLRRLFATDRENPTIKDPFIGLFDVLNLPLPIRVARPRNHQADRTDFLWRYEGRTHRFPQKYILSTKQALRKVPGAPCMVFNLQAFQDAWKVFTNNVFSSMTNWDNILVAGGSVLACLTFFPNHSHDEKKLFEMYQSNPYKSSDIDLFLWGMNEEEAKKKMQEIFNAVNSSAKLNAVCFRTKNTITIQTEFPNRAIQIVMRLYQSPAEILCGFDVDCCCFAYNGINVLTNPRGLSAIIRQCNTIDLSRRSPSYEHRLAKYSNRGYEIFYPLLERGMINYNRLASPTRVKFPQGLGRLIVYEIMRANYEYFPRLYEDAGGPVRRSPLSMEQLRPSNYDYAWCKIPYGPKWWDTGKVQNYVDRVGEQIASSIFMDRLRAGTATHHDHRDHVITSGNMEQCLERCCTDYDFDNEPSEVQTREDMASGLFRGPATFMSDNPGRQLVGSFNPTSSSDWESDACLDGLDNDDEE